MNRASANERRRRTGAWLIAAGLALQGLLVALGGHGAPGPIAAGAGLATLAPLAALAWCRGRRSFARDVVLVTVSLGGLGMLLGARADAALAEPVHAGLAHAAPPRHAPYGEPAPVHRHVSAFDPRPLASWMGVGMLALCAPACWLLCAPCPARRRWAAHGACLAGMVAGMLAGGALLTAALETLAASGAGAHLAMLAGMVAGTGLAGLPFARGSDAAAWSSG